MEIRSLLFKYSGGQTNIKIRPNQQDQKRDIPGLGWDNNSAAVGHCDSQIKVNDLFFLFMRFKSPHI